MSQYAKTVEKLNETSAEIDRMPCLWCREPTARATLNQYGARCFRCYEAYCAEPQPPAKVTAPKARDVMADADAAAVETELRETRRRVAAYVALNHAKDGQDVDIERINAELRLSGDLS